MTVELFDASKHYAAPAGAQLVYGGGALMNLPKIVAVFVDELAGGAYALTAEMSAFLTEFMQTADTLSMLKEYDKGGAVEESGTFSGGFALSLGTTTPPPPPPPPGPGGDCSAEIAALLACLGYAKPSNAVAIQLSAASNKHAAGSTSTTLQDADVQNLIDANITSLLPAPDANTLYCVFFPTGVTIQFGTDASCTTFCGYHNSFVDSNGNTIRYAALPFPDCAGCLGGMTAKDALTSVTTHEIAEAVTDAAADGSGWYDQANGEIGDICAWMTKLDAAGNTVQLLWSNAANNCI
jgi:hypothetical protein